MVKNNKEIKKLQPLEKFSRLKWACRRGMLELDLILLRFLNEQFQALNEEEQVQLEELLKFSDPEIFSWIFGGGEPPTDLKTIVELIKRDTQSAL